MSLVSFVLVVAYIAGVWKFWSGFNRTNFSQGRVYLSLMWPVLLLFNKTYRQNFTRALRG